LLVKVKASALVLMGVSGSGKTCVGQALSDELGWPFYDGDDYHPPDNVKKMSEGIPLRDEDRDAWLDTLNSLISQRHHSGEDLILACSALKQKYRQRLRSGNDDLIFVYLKGDFDLIWSRMKNRDDHFMKPNMLQSQFNTLEVPSDALQVDIDQPVEGIVQEIVEYLKTSHD